MRQQIKSTVLSLLLSVGFFSTSALGQPVNLTDSVFVTLSNQSTIACVRNGTSNIRKPGKILEINNPPRFISFRSISRRKIRTLRKRKRNAQSEQRIVRLQKKILRVKSLLQEANAACLNVSVENVRGFRMGFTAFPHDNTFEAAEETRNFVHQYADIIAHHFDDGVPWMESLNGDPFPQSIDNSWNGRLLMVPPDAKVFLALSPGREGLKLAEGAEQLRAPLVGANFASPDVKTAYLNYCLRAIEFFNPDYLAIGIEVNELYSSNPTSWDEYVYLHQFVYQEIKLRHPKLSVFASLSLHTMYKDVDMAEAYKSILPFSDLIGVSFYPFFLKSGSSESAFLWMQKQFESFNKPYSITETNDSAQNIQFPSGEYTIQGSRSAQKAFTKYILEQVDENNYRFVIFFVHRDYDDLWVRFGHLFPELFISWRDSGLLKGTGEERPAFKVYKNNFSKELVE